MGLRFDGGPLSLWRIEQGHVLDVLRRMPDRHFQTCVTSPPYLGLRDYGLPPTTWGDGWDGCLGLEPSPEMFVGHLVEVFSEVKRVLRDDGLLWLVLGDSYASTGTSRWPNTTDGFGNGYGKHGAWHGGEKLRAPLGDAKAKDLLMVPAQVALALRADGWYLRDQIVWHKPNPMPGSQKDRCTSSYEFAYMLAKQSRYYFDYVAVREPDKGTDHKHRNVLDGQPSLEPTNGLMTAHQGLRTENGRNGAGRTKRNVWTIATVPFPGAHFAVFPPKLIEPMILAGSGISACSVCGAPTKRVVERTPMEWREGPTRDDAVAAGSGRGRTVLSGTMTKAATITTTGFVSSCEHEGMDDRSIVLDPFAGAGTTGLVAVRHGRHFVGIELSEKFCEMARERISDGAPINSAPDVHGVL